jgi:hypothetical protein
MSKLQQLDINFETSHTPPQPVMEQKEITEPVVHADASAMPEQELLSPSDIRFKIMFDELQHNFITRSRKDIAIELKKVENRTALLQDKINMLHNEVERLSAIDLDTEFKKMQGNIGYIAQAVNEINSSFNNSISGMGANVGNGLSSTNDSIRRFADDAAKGIARLDEDTKSNMLFLEHKIQALTDQNRQLKKGLKTNNIIQVIFFLLLLGAAVYIIAYQAGVRIK